MKHSIAKQLSAVFISLIVFVLASNLLINNFFLEKYYVYTLEKKLVEAYTLIDENSDNLTESNISFLQDLRKMCWSNNMALVVVDSMFRPILHTARSASLMTARLNGYYIDKETQEDTTILRQNGIYTIQRKEELAQNTEYLEMWGKLTASGYFMIRIPMSSIQESVRISNRFILYISFFAILLCVIATLMISGRIVKPLRELTELSKRMADLDFEARYTSGGSNEIGQLGEHFNRMSDTLQQTISKLKSANNQLMLDIDRKEKIDRMRTDFIANVSHELKTPLALISGYAEGLQECISDDEESREYYCEVIIDEAAKMTAMVQKLMTLNQIEFGNDEVTMERFDIAELIHIKMQSIQILAQQKEAQIIFEGPEKLYVWGDVFKIEEVLTNYLSNALNHVDGERRITVRAVSDGELARISVINTGERIPEEDIDLIWDKFYKVDKARTREYGGSGVGLSIVKAIMDSMHQKCGVINLQDGVEFWFELEDAASAKESV